MAESSDGQEKTEDPTEKKLREAREKGQVARSRELTTTVMLMTAALGLLAFGPMVVSALGRVMVSNFSLRRAEVFDTRYMIDGFLSAVAEALIALAPFLVLLVVSAIAGSIALSGWNFSVQALAPKFSKMNPLSGMKRIFGPQGAMELGKALAKFFVIGICGLTVLYFAFEPVMGLGMEPVNQAIAHSGELIFWGFFAVSASMIVIAAFDVPFQLWNHKRQLKMTKQEVKQENKDTDGSPELKARIRRTQMDMAMHRMMEKVPEADVVITNPHHFSVAIKYDQNKMNAPILVAKGADLVAFEIRKIAQGNDVPLMASPALARALFFTTELDEEVPEGLYLAVARVLAYVYHLKQQFGGAYERKDLEMNDLPIPEDMQFDAKGKKQ
ncbi:flagellar biosynthetic protein FlhB [Candidatus Tenderia electrophaga]|jgi:flagellar biosynthetic protein FlhB|uniref:Flagellar biosynthetic protein FlhB n=1 Tax=Candidatus Tenderia electrophaga TaxID=1748243 RepID=A0A0S2TBZ2_9GAMM|nr:flagellar biosynthetic protein FlhB [Candidatus Tenderia electrophaga]